MLPALPEPLPPATGVKPCGQWSVVVLADPEQPPADAALTGVEQVLGELGGLTRANDRLPAQSAGMLAGALRPWRSYRLQSAAEPEQLYAQVAPWIGQCEVVITASDAGQPHVPALEGFSLGCRARRRVQPLLRQASRQAFRHIGIIPPASAQRACDAISDRMDRFAEGLGQEPRYHNRHHTVDTLLAIASLLRVALQQGQLGDHDAITCIIAMNGHDLLHDGTINRPGHHLETIAASAVGDIMHECGCADDDIETVRAVILATDPTRQQVLRLRNLTDPQTRLAAMCLIAGDADLFASLLPGIGAQLSIDLAAEWRAAQISFPAMPDTPQGRRGFLGSIPSMSDAGEVIGLSDIVRDQLAGLPP